MSARKPDPTPASLAKAHRQRLAAEEGARAIADVERDGVSIRKNMDRLRALRAARDAEAAAEALLAPPAPAKKAKAKVKRIVR